MKNKLPIALLIFTIVISNYSCKEKDIEPKKLNIQNRKISSLDDGENEAQAY